MVTKERLTELADKNTICEVSYEERVALATELLELRQQLEADNPKQDGGWIAWGGDCGGNDQPVIGVVEVQFKNGSTAKAEADVWYWPHDGCGSDIIAYRVVS